MRFNFGYKIKEYLPRYCMSCGRSDSPLEIHHIKGRKNECHSSYLNAIMLCKECHDSAVCNDEVASTFMIKTFKLLDNKGYKLKEKDIDFMLHYKNIYVLIIQEIFGRDTKDL